MDESVKRCPRCEKVLPREAFRFYERTGRLQGWCRDCHNEYGKQWREARPGYQSALTKTWRERNPDVVEEYNAARRRGPVELVCEECGERFLSKRKDTLACSSRCRARRASVKKP